jgi:hypothetical protein
MRRRLLWPTLVTILLLTVVCLQPISSVEIVRWTIAGAA